MKTNIITYISFILWSAFALGCSKDPMVLENFSSRISFNTQVVSAIGQNSATSGIQVSGGFGDEILEKGICWGTDINPTINLNKRSGGAGGGFVSLSLTVLTPATIYYIRGYVVTKNEVIYSDQKQFSTLGYQLATISTTAVTNITRNTAVSGGNITAGGGGSITARGVCWNTAANPTILYNKTSDGSGTGTFSSDLTGLNPGTVYYVRAYATNQAGTTYGTQVSFVTASISLATLSTTVITSITQTTALASANVTADGGGTITAKGVCWSTISNPTIANSRTIAGSGLGSYSSSITGLNPATTYYVRSYATNQAGTVYGTQVSFTTTGIQLATVSGVTISGINRTAVTIASSVTADGGGAVTSRGVCWSTGSNPSVPGSSYTSNGSGTGAISGSLTGLVSGTTYYVRAYAINAAGTSYGVLTSFKTL
jgi:hypothetical protein